MEILANRLKTKRTAMHLTQNQLSDNLNINRVTYQGYETNRHNPDLETLVKLADKLETSTDYLLGRYA